jgi:antitoxin CcdA
MNAVNHRLKSPRGKTATNISLNAAMIAEAKELGINISQACEAGLVMELKSVRESKWKSENEATMRAWNDWTEKNGIPLAEHRRF